MRVLIGLLGRACLLPRLVDVEDPVQAEDGEEKDAGIHPQRRKSAYNLTVFFGQFFGRRLAVV